MIYQYDYYVKRWKNGGYYAVCFSSMTKATKEHIVENVNKELGLEDKPGTIYSITEIEIPSGKGNTYNHVTGVVDQEECEKRNHHPITLNISGTDESFTVCDMCGKEL